MNYFGFDLNDALVGLFAFYFSGVIFGVLVLGFLRFSLLSVFERRET